MALFGKRDPQVTEGIERDINQFPAYVQDGYTLKTATERSGFKGRGLNVAVDLSTPAVTARFSADTLADLCHGRVQIIDADNTELPLFLAASGAGSSDSDGFDALRDVAQGSAALLKGTETGMEVLLVLDANALAAIGQWLELVPAAK